MPRRAMRRSGRLSNRLTRGCRPAKPPRWKRDADLLAWVDSVRAGIMRRDRVHCLPESSRRGRLPGPQCPAVGEGVDVLLTRTQKIQKVHANVLTGLTDAQEN